MALYREGKAAMAADGTVTGTGTKWQSSLSLIRPGATIMFLSSPIQMAVVNRVVSDTEIKAITTNGAVVASTDYAILLSDSLTVDGLAQDVAETLRYYQSQETVIAEALEFFKDFDLNALQELADQVKADAEASATNAAAAAASEGAAKTSEINAKASEVAAETARDQVQQIINDAGEQSTLVVLAQKDGFSHVGRCPDIETLRTIEPVNPGEMISVVAYHSGWAATSNPSGGGWFVYDAADTATVDEGGSCIVTAGGKRWKRMREAAIISLAEYGIAPGSGADISVALQAAINWSRANDITTITIPASRTPYVMTKSVSADTTNTPIEILGGSGKNMDEVTIEHYYDSDAGTTWAIKFFNTVAGAPCWKTAKSSGIYAYCMDSINPLHFYRFNDGWRNELTNFHAHGYIKSSAFVLCNDISWTENFYCENLNIRHCKSMCQLYTNSAWHSFYGFTARNIFFNHGNLVGGPSEAIVLGTGTEPGRAFLYAADIDIGGWLGTVYPGQPHIGIRVRQYSSLVESKVTSRYDGVSSPNLGNNFRMFVTDNVNAMVDVEYINHNNQYGYIEGAFTLPAAGNTVTARLWDNLAYPTNDGSTYTQGRCTFGNSPWGARCPIRLRGGKLVYRTSLTSAADAVTAAGILRIEGLPVLSTFAIELRVNGPNHSNAQRFIVTTQNQDYVASVQRLDALQAATAVNSVFNSSTSTVTSTAETTLSPKNSFSTNGLYVRTYNNINAGAYNANQGCKVDIMIPPALYRGVSTNDGTPVAGNNYGIEIEMIQL